MKTFYKGFTIQASRKSLSKDDENFGSAFTKTCGPYTAVLDAWPSKGRLNPVILKSKKLNELKKEIKNFWFKK